jgi:hypothetical protein
MGLPSVTQLFTTHIRAEDVVVHKAQRTFTPGELAINREISYKANYF